MCVDGEGYEPTEPAEMRNSSWPVTCWAARLLSSLLDKIPGDAGFTDMDEDDMDLGAKITMNSHVSGVTDCHCDTGIAGRIAGVQLLSQIGGILMAAAFGCFKLRIY
jgi:hypothetical protein